MRQILFIVTLLASTAVLAATDAQQMVGYECKHIDSAKSGFTCAIERGGLHLHWTKNLKQEPKEFSERSNYLFKKVYLRYFSAGGNSLVITGDHWPSDAAMVCSPTPSRQGKICNKCRGKDADGNYKCDN